MNRPQLKGKGAMTMRNERKATGKAAKERPIDVGRPANPKQHESANPRLSTDADKPRQPARPGKLFR